MHHVPIIRWRGSQAPGPFLSPGGGPLEANGHLCEREIRSPLSHLTNDRRAILPPCAPRFPSTLERDLPHTIVLSSLTMQLLIR
jgi:hypothetical protein